MAESLRALQRELLTIIRRQAPAEHAARRLVVGDARRSASGRLRVYQTMYALRLREVLGSTFPRLARALGSDRFAALADDYLLAFPSRHPSLRDLGSRLPAFMRRASTGAALPPWTAALAALEWARHDVFDEEDTPVLTTERLRAVAPAAFGALPLRLVPAHRVLTVRHAVEEAWRDPESYVPAPAPRTFLVWRQNTAVYHRAIDAREKRALRIAADGPFSAVCEETARAHRDPARRAFELLARWVADGLLVDTLGAGR